MRVRRHCTRNGDRVLLLMKPEGGHPATLDVLILSRPAITYPSRQLHSSKRDRLPPIARQCRRFIGESLVSLVFADVWTILNKSLIGFARPTRFELVTSAFGGQLTSRKYGEGRPFYCGCITNNRGNQRSITFTGKPS